MKPLHPGAGRKKFHAILGVFCIALLALAFLAGAAHSAEPEYDRLDGTGESGKKVHVIEWEGNLEIHVTPRGSLAGLALKLDKRTKNKPVMVIGYRFTDAPKKQLIRRNVLTIDLHDGFKTYKDPSADDYDKVIVSNNGLSEQVVAYALDPEPKQLYPEGHPALAQAVTPEERAPAAASSGAKSASTNVTPSRSTATTNAAPVEENAATDDGTIQPFFMQAREPDPQQLQRAERNVMRR